MNKITLQDVMVSARESAILSAIIIVALIGSFLAVEPTVSRAIEDQFTITQSVTAEISFLTAANNVTMSSSIPGITGGTATGEVDVRVYTNNSTGYTMTIVSSSSPAMQGNAEGGTIQDYTPSQAGRPDYAFAVGANTGEFGYTVSASTTAELAQKFLDNGADTCNTGGADTSGNSTCWYGLSTTATSTIVTAAETTSSGSTSTIYFQTQITSNPAPAIPEDTYVATTTLTATINP